MRPLALVVAARPNFIKMAPVIRAVRRRGLPHEVVHTGQHYDEGMSGIFFAELRMPRPDHHLGVGSGSHAEQTGRTMMAFERLLPKLDPSLVVVGGDVNATAACALAAAKACIPVVHVEAGLRSFDRTMPEEINRVVADHLAELLFTTEPTARDNLRREGIAPGRIHFVGNTMIDSLRAHLAQARAQAPWERLGLAPRSYGVVTLHRPSNVDDSRCLARMIGALLAIARRLPLVFPVHPRTARRLKGIATPGLRLAPPLGYLPFLGLMSAARLVLTDSGGIQEETTVLGVPCLTLRRNTERPVTVTEGTNSVVGTDPARIVLAARKVLHGRGKVGRVPRLWDGKAGERIAATIERWCGKRR